jgi:AcrR family transcriptional regulator
MCRERFRCISRNLLSEGLAAPDSTIHPRCNMASRNGTTSEDPGKRQAILEQAIRTFAEVGFRGTDVQVIADRAGVGKGTVYRYFHCKEDLFWASTYAVIVRMEQHVFGAVERVEGTLAKFRAAAAAHAQFFQDNPQYLELTIQDRAEFRGTGPESHSQRHEEMIRRFADILQQGIDSGELRPMDTQRTTLAWGSMLFGTAFLGCYPKSLDIRQMSEYAVEIFLHGIRADQPGSCRKQSVENSE